MRIPRKHDSVRIFLLLPLLSFPTLAYAQLEEVVVTAQKRQQLLEDVPISMTVISADRLGSLAIGSFEELALQIPNLRINDTPANNQIFIRGIGTSGNVLAFEQSVALFVDDIYGGRNRQYHQPFLDIERIEVLRGPQGALFGRNTSAGAVSVTTAQPKSTTERWIEGEYEGQFESYSVTAGLSGPLSDRFRGRVVAKLGELNGHVRNTALNRDEPSRDDVIVRATGVFEPNDRLRVTAKVQYSESEIIGAAFEFVPFPQRPDYIVNTNDALAPIVDDSTTYNGVLRFDYEIGAHTLTAITGYSAYDYQNAFNIQWRAPPRLVTVGEEDFAQVSQELRLASEAGGRLEYMLGAYFDRHDMELFRNSLIDVRGIGVPNNESQRFFDQVTDTLSLFGQGTLKLTETLKINAGLRWSSIEKDVSLERFTIINNTTLVPGTPLQGNRDESGLDPSLSLQWDVTPDIMVYTSYAQGSKSGGFNGASGAATAQDYEFEDEESEAFEIGTKIVVPSINAFIGLSVFRTDYTDLQRSTLDINQAIFITGNAAEARSEGVEIEANWQPLPALRTSASLAYLEARYTSYPNGPCVFPNDSIPNCSQELAGVQLANAPSWSGNVNLDVDQPVGNRLRLQAGLNASFQDDVFYQDAINPLERQTAFWKINIRAGLADSERRWSVSLVVKNVFDERTSSLIGKTFPVGIAPNDRIHFVDPPRTYTLQGRFNF